VSEITQLRLCILALRNKNMRTSGSVGQASEFRGEGFGRSSGLRHNINQHLSTLMLVGRGRNDRQAVKQFVREVTH